MILKFVGNIATTNFDMLKVCKSDRAWMGLIAQEQKNLKNMYWMHDSISRTEFKVTNPYKPN